MLIEPLSAVDARTLVRKILADHDVTFTKHAEDEMAKDNLTAPDVANILRNGIVDAPEFENGSWRYRVRTQHIVVVVAFRSETEARVITAWRIRR